jgi:hypothetical protein
MVIGIVRTSAFDEIFNSAQLDWTTVSGGKQVAAFTVVSPEAEGLRLKFIFESIPAGTEIRFFNPHTSEVVGPVTQSDILRGNLKIYWSPTIKSEAIGVELVIPDAGNPDELQFTVPMLSHLFALPEQSLNKNLDDIDKSGSCNNDVACATNVPRSIIDSVAKYAFVDDEKGPALCTGTLLVDTDTTTIIPYFFTANHCVGSSSEAASMEFYWFFQRASCNGPDPFTVTLQRGGATLLSTSTNTDYTLLQLNGTPPAGVGFSGWTNALVAAGSDVFSIHHPQGDLKKISFGDAQGFAPYLGDINGNGPFIYTQWFDGTTEPGSSGAGLWAEFNNNLFLVGSLFGGFAACNAQSEPDYYGRFDLTYPSVAAWLNPPQQNAFTKVWWDPSRNGQGIQILQSGNLISGAWYLYDENGDGMWVTFVGTLNGNRLSATLLRFTGPPLGTIWDNSQVVDSSAGQVTIDFASSQAATFSYTLNGVSNVLQIQPFNAAATGTFTRVWWDPSRSGQGVQLLQENNAISGAWYLYDENGDGMWVTFSGVLSGSTVTTDLLRFTGPALGTPWNNNQVNSTVVGTVTLSFQSNSAVTMSYIVNSISDHLNLQPFNL